MPKLVADFFAGIGLMRYALEAQGWSEVYALDHSPEKKAMYKAHFREGNYQLEDIRCVSGRDVPNVALAHASFPCTDTSVAGAREGLAGRESTLFWEFIRIVEEMRERRPSMILLENVDGFLTSSEGRDIEAALEAICELGYTVDLLLIDAAYFVPQSRVRLFVVGTRGTERQNVLEQEFILNTLSEARPDRIVSFIRCHPNITWGLRNIPRLPQRRMVLADIIDPLAEWWPPSRTQYLYDQMYPRHQEKVQKMMKGDDWSYGTVFRRMRQRDGRKQSTAELRTDGIAGCLRTPKGGSARQIILRGGKNTFDARLINARESARLMGAPDYYISPDSALNQALYGFGDAVCVPVVEWLAANYLNQLYEEVNAPWRVTS